MTNSTFFKTSLFFVGLCLIALTSKSIFAQNRIEGMVYDPNRVPINDIRVELFNDVGSILGGTKTSSGGRFTFWGISRGRFTVRVVPAGRNFLEETKDVEIVGFSRNSNNNVAYIDVYLRYDKRISDLLKNVPAEVIFAQDIPENAKDLYESGIKDIKKNPDKGILEIEEALKIFPNYFDALNALGKQYIARKEYQKAYPYLLRAIDVNPRSISAFYSLAYAFYQLNEIPAALEAAKAVLILAPAYVDAQILYGTLLRMNKNYKEAETALLKAKSLSKDSNAEVHWQLALLYNKLNRNQDAVKELEAYLKINPQSADNRKIQELIEKLKNSK